MNFSSQPFHKVDYCYYLNITEKKQKRWRPAKDTRDQSVVETNLNLCLCCSLSDTIKKRREEKRRDKKETNLSQHSHPLFIFLIHYAVQSGSPQFYSKIYLEGGKRFLTILLPSLKSFDLILKQMFLGSY